MIGTEATTRIARTADEVVQAWSLVHDRYVEQGLIEPDPSRIFAPSSAIADSTIVVMTGDPLMATITAVVDHPGGLPADSVYHSELNLLRRCGAALIEVCLTASRTSSVALMVDKCRVIWWYAHAIRATHVVFAAHPRDLEIYCRLVGFARFGVDRKYADRRDAPAALGILNVEDVPQFSPLPHAIKTFMRHPIPAKFFESRYRFPSTDKWRFAA